MKRPPCPYCGAPMRWTTEGADEPCIYLVNGVWEPDGFACTAKPYCKGLYLTPEIWQQSKRVASEIR